MAETSQNIYAFVLIGCLLIAVPLSILIPMAMVWLQRKAKEKEAEYGSNDQQD